MLYLKPANFEDFVKEYRFVADEPADENGFTNDFSGVSLEHFKESALSRMIDWSNGKNLPEGFVPETFYFLWSDEACLHEFCGDEGTGKSRTPCMNEMAPSSHKIVGEFRLRHHLVPALETGSGHVGQYIHRDFRGRGYCTEGLRLLIEEAKKIVPEDVLYLHCNVDNEASLRVMLKNGGVIHHKNDAGYFVRIPLR